MAIKTAGQLNAIRIKQLKAIRDPDIAIMGRLTEWQSAALAIERFTLAAQHLDSRSLDMLSAFHAKIKRVVTRHERMASDREKFRRKS